MKLFLDDVRDPPDDTWVVARSYDEAVEVIQLHGLSNIEMVSFDHDLGSEKTGMDVAHFLINLDLDTGALLDQFTFKVHSANPVGHENIEALLERYLRFRHEQHPSRTP